MYPAFHFNADPDPASSHQGDAYLPPLAYRHPPGLHFERPRFHLEHRKLLNFAFKSDPNPASPPDVVTVLASQNDSPDLQP
jgi:hypothetical protein